jgi:hypothetical protein
MWVQGEDRRSNDLDKLKILFYQPPFRFVPLKIIAQLRAVELFAPRPSLFGKISFQSLRPCGKMRAL